MYNILLDRPGVKDLELAARGFFGVRPDPVGFFCGIFPWLGSLKDLPSGGPLFHYLQHILRQIGRGR